MVGSNSQIILGTIYNLTDIVVVSYFLFVLKSFPLVKHLPKIFSDIFFKKHEDFDNTADNDVALLFIDGEVEADGVTVDFVTLAESDAEDFVGNDCEIAGWGQTESKLPSIVCGSSYHSPSSNF